MRAYRSSLLLATTAMLGSPCLAQLAQGDFVIHETLATTTGSNQRWLAINGVTGASTVINGLLPPPPAGSLRNLHIDQASGDLIWFAPDQVTLVPTMFRATLDAAMNATVTALTTLTAVPRASYRDIDGSFLALMPNNDVLRIGAGSAGAHVINLNVTGANPCTDLCSDPVSGTIFLLEPRGVTSCGLWDVAPAGGPATVRSIFSVRGLSIEFDRGTGNILIGGGVNNWNSSSPQPNNLWCGGAGGTTQGTTFPVGVLTGFQSNNRSELGDLFVESATSMWFAENTPVQPGIARPQGRLRPYTLPCSVGSPGPVLYTASSNVGPATIDRVVRFVRYPNYGHTPMRVGGRQMIREVTPPTVGMTGYTLELHNVALGSGSFFMMGFSDAQMSSSPQTLPFGLAGSGFPGFAAYADPAATLFGTANVAGTVIDPGNRRVVTVNIPPGMAGVTFFTQFLFLDSSLPGGGGWTGALRTTVL